GVQLVDTNGDEPELATIVHQDDIVLMPQGYHPNVAAPGGSINFLWMMAANREREDRKYGVFNVQTEFAPKLTAARLNECRDSFLCIIEARRAGCDLPVSR